jgi:hypothetical protein
VAANQIRNETGDGERTYSDPNVVSALGNFERLGTDSSERLTALKA